MALEIVAITRSFTFKKGKKTISLKDPDTNYSPEQVLDFYTAQYPELQTATVGSMERIGDKFIFPFSTTLGTKG